MHQHLAHNQLEDVVSIGGGVDGLLLQDQLLLLHPKLLQDPAHRLSLCYPPLKNSNISHFEQGHDCENIKNLFWVAPSRDDFHGILLFSNLGSQGTTISELDKS